MKFKIFQTQGDLKKEVDISSIEELAFLSKLEGGYYLILDFSSTVPSIEIYNNYRE